MIVPINSFLFAITLSSLALLWVPASETVSDNQEQYRCTPCGSDCDAELYDRPGKCRQCGMELVKSSTIHIKDIPPGDACQYISSHPGIILLDVRTPREFNGNGSGDLGKLRDAINIPIQDLEDRLGELNEFKDKEILVYCSHSQRSPRAAYLLSQKGFSKVLNMSGGLSRMGPGDCREKAKK